MPALCRHFLESPSCAAPHICSQGTPRPGWPGTCQGPMAVAEGVEAPALAQPKARQACLICQCLNARPHQSPWPAPCSQHRSQAAPVLCTGASAKAGVVVLGHQPIPGGCPARQALLPPELPEPPSQLPSGGCTASSHQRFRSVPVVGEGSLESALLLWLNTSPLRAAQRRAGPVHDPWGQRVGRRGNSPRS